MPKVIQKKFLAISKNKIEALSIANTTVDSEPKEKPFTAYEAASTLLENAIQSGSVDEEFEIEFFQHLQNLPADESLVLGAKYADSINKGLIDSPVFQGFQVHED